MSTESERAAFKLAEVYEKYEDFSITLKSTIKEARLAGT